jgi:hypothetical protein
MVVMIGVDQHKGSHTAVAIDRDETELASVTVRATRRQVDELLAWGHGSRTARGRSSLRVGSVISSRGSLSPRVRRCWRRGCGCWGRAGRTRTIRTTHGRSRSRRCTHRVWRAWVVMITRVCCGSTRSVTRTWAGPGTAPRAGCMRCWPSSSRAESPRTSTLAAPNDSSLRSLPRRQWNEPERCSTVALAGTRVSAQRHRGEPCRGSALTPEPIAR